MMKKRKILKSLLKRRRRIEEDLCSSYVCRRCYHVDVKREGKNLEHNVLVRNMLYSRFPDSITKTTDGQTSNKRPHVLIFRNRRELRSICTKDTLTSGARVFISWITSLSFVTLRPLM